jgi:hypothetical protein
MDNGPARMNAKMGRAIASGIILGFLGAALDFCSGYLLLAPGSSTTNDMGMAVPASSALAWGIGVSVLGVAVLATSVTSLLPIGSRRMSTIGALMIIFGGVMLVVGASMYAGGAPTMQGASLVGVGMLGVGALMAVNGAVMARTHRTM